VAVLVLATTTTERTGLFFFLLAALNNGTTEPDFPAHGIDATPSFMFAAASTIGFENL